MALLCSFFSVLLLSLAFARFTFFLAAVKSWSLVMGKAWKWDLDQLYIGIMGHFTTIFAGTKADDVVFQFATSKCRRSARRDCCADRSMLALSAYQEHLVTFTFGDIVTSGAKSSSTQNVYRRRCLKDYLHSNGPVKGSTSVLKTIRKGYFFCQSGTQKSRGSDIGPPPPPG